MADLKEKAIALLGSATVDLQTGDTKSTAYTVPVGKEALITMVIIHSPTASLASGTDYDIGSGAACDTWKQSNNLSSMTATTDYMVITHPGTKFTIETAGLTFGILQITGATLDAQATMEVYGVERDA